MYFLIKKPILNLYSSVPPYGFIFIKNKLVLYKSLKSVKDIKKILL